MEDSRILNRRHWSPIRKSQVIVTAIVASVTMGMVAYDVAGVLRWEHEKDAITPHSSGSSLAVTIFLTLMLPADDLARALGIEPSLGYLGLRLFAVAVNTAMAFGLGSLIGWLVVITKSKTPKLAAGKEENEEKP